MPAPIHSKCTGPFSDDGGLGSPLSPSYFAKFAEEELEQILATLGTPESVPSTDELQPPSRVMVAATVPVTDGVAIQ